MIVALILKKEHGNNVKCTFWENKQALTTLKLEEDMIPL